MGYILMCSVAHAFQNILFVTANCQKPGLLLRSIPLRYVIHHLSSDSTCFASFPSI